jgi:hypothetical protein
MRHEPLIQQLFAIERAIGTAAPGTLRAMVIEAQETALRMELDNLHDIDALRHRLELHQLAAVRQFAVADEEADFSRSA